MCMIGIARRRDQGEGACGQTSRRGHSDSPVCQQERLRRAASICTYFKCRYINCFVCLDSCISIPSMRLIIVVFIHILSYTIVYMYLYMRAGEGGGDGALRQGLRGCV